jgi:gamma-glutamyl:cysteine ligase YbdK (ATP-grasp superfamily)
VGGESVSELIERTLEELAPHAHELGCAGELDGVRRILRDGNGADHQLAVYAATKDPVEVTREVVETTRLD